MYSLILLLTALLWRVGSLDISRFGATFHSGITDKLTCTCGLVYFTHDKKRLFQGSSFSYRSRRTPNLFDT